MDFTGSCTQPEADRQDNITFPNSITWIHTERANNNYRPTTTDLEKGINKLTLTTLRHTAYITVLTKHKHTFSSIWKHKMSSVLFPNWKLAHVLLLFETKSTHNVSALYYSPKSCIKRACHDLCACEIQTTVNLVLWRTAGAILNGQCVTGNTDAPNVCKRVTALVYWVKNAKFTCSKAKDKSISDEDYCIFTIRIC